MHETVSLCYRFSFELEYLVFSKTNNLLQSFVTKNIMHSAGSKTYCNNISNSCAKVSRVGYFL